MRGNGAANLGCHVVRSLVVILLCLLYMRDLKSAEALVNRTQSERKCSRTSFVCVQIGRLLLTTKLRETILGGLVL